MLYEAIIFLGGEPFSLGIDVPSLKSKVFFGSKLYERVKEGEEVGVYFPSWREIGELISIAFGRKEFKNTPLHFKWKISSVEEREYEDELGKTKVKILRFFGEIPSEEFLLDKICRGDSLALEASIYLSKWEKNKIWGELKREARKKAKKAISLGTRAEGILRELFSRQKVYWAFTGAITYAEDCYRISEELGRKVEVVRRATKAGREVMKSIGIEIEEEKEPFPEASKALAGEYDLIVIAPCTLNTLAKISLGISDSPASCAASHAMKGGYPVIILPTDLSGEYFLPSGKHEKEPFFLSSLLSEILRSRGIKIVKDPKGLKEALKEELFEPF